MRSLESKQAGNGETVKRGRFDMGVGDEKNALDKGGMSAKRDVRHPDDASVHDGKDGVQNTPQLDRATQTRIGDQLRSMYNELMDQPVPDRFTTLLQQLDQPRDAHGDVPPHGPDGKGGR
ncbi:MAG: NepR family anti-sigma factor [Salinarimonas sp.]